MAYARHPLFETVSPSAADFASRRDRSLFRQIADLLRTWVERDRQRRQLAELSDHLLRDIGVTRTEAMCEAAKPFWVFETKHD